MDPAKTCFPYVVLLLVVLSASKPLMENISDKKDCLKLRELVSTCGGSDGTQAGVGLIPIPSAADVPTGYNNDAMGCPEKCSKVKL